VVAHHDLEFSLAGFRQAMRLLGCDS
jgi:hypothetical protein